MESTPAPIDTDLASQLVEQAFGEARETLARWFGEDGLRENLATEIQHDLAATRDDGVCTIDLPGGGRRVAVVYVAPGLLPEPKPMPEAHIRHRNFALESERDVKRLAEAVREYLGPYRPKKVLIYTYGEKPLFDSRPDMHVVAGLIDELHPPSGKQSPQFRLEEPRSADFYEMYREWYEEFWRRRPQLRDEVPIETKEDFEECLEACGVRLVHIDGRPCGLLAAQPRFEFALRGWRMRERVIAPDMWGRGVSAPSLVAFARSLRHTDRDAIWGTIHVSNQWSLKTARGVGRRITATLHEIA